MREKGNKGKSWGKSKSNVNQRFLPSASEEERTAFTCDFSKVALDFCFFFWVDKSEKIAGMGISICGSQKCA